MFPIADDNSEIRIVPFVTYAIIAVNVIVFVLLQGLGGNDAFTYAFSLVPKEITTGTDLTGLVQITDSAGQGAWQSSASADPAWRLFQFLEFDVYARRYYAHLRQYAVSVDICRQHRKSHRTFSFCNFLHHLRFGGRIWSNHNGYEFGNSDAWGFGRDFGRAWRLSPAFPKQTSESDNV